MSQYDYDLFVIGAGSGGVRAARMAAALGVRVAVAEDRYLGGTCVNVGCVPKKLYVYASHFLEDFHDSANFGWQQQVVPEFHWPTLRDNKITEIKRLNGIYDNLLKNAGADLIDGRATVTGAHTVEINGKELSAERILVATGGWPFIPEFPGSEHAISSNEVFDLEDFPKHAVVVGGGYIAVEFAGIFNGLGADTELLYRGELFLRGFDQDVREFVSGELTKKGITTRFKTNITRIDKTENGQYAVQLDSGDSLTTDLVLYATGRVPNTLNLGLETAGVELDGKGAIKVDENFQTNVPSIYALGDVIDRVQLTPVALAEGMALVKHLYQGQPVAVDYRQIPTAVFCQPNIGTVGLAEHEARDKYSNIQIFRSSFKPLKHTISGSDERTLMKLIVDADSDKVVGVHMVGAEAGEIIQGIGIALRAGATKSCFDSTIGIHPTTAEEFVTMREPVSS